MGAGQFPIDQQVAQFRTGLPRNCTLTEVLARAAVLNLPGWYLVARPASTGQPRPSDSGHQTSTV